MPEGRVAPRGQRAKQVQARLDSPNPVLIDLTDGTDAADLSSASATQTVDFELIVTPAGQAPRDPSVFLRFGSPHRVASRFLAVSTLAALTSAALLWSLTLSGRWTILSATATAATFLSLFANGYFRINIAGGDTIRLRLVTAASAIGVTTALVVVSLPGLNQPEVRHFVPLMAALGLAAIVSRWLGHIILRWLWARGHLRARALFLGYDVLARELAAELDHRKNAGVNIVGYIKQNGATSAPTAAGALPRPIPEELIRDIVAADPDRLIIGPSSGVCDREAQQIARWASTQGIAVHVVPRFYQMGMGMDSMSPDRARGYPLVRLQRSAHPFLSRKLKRLMDIVVSIAVLLLASPLMALAAAAIRLTSPGPVLYAQERVGQHGRTIIVRKFRSMTVSDTGDHEWDAEQRITRVGRLLRRTNIDELPQLLSILAGDMSLVGPRPERPVFVEQFRQTIPDYDDRHRMPVGLTGLAQVVGLRGDTSISERVKYDNLYIDQWSLRTDFEILLRTVTAVLFQRAKEQTLVELEHALSQQPVASNVLRSE